MVFAKTERSIRKRNRGKEIRDSDDLLKDIIKVPNLPSAVWP